MTTTPATIANLAEAFARGLRNQLPPETLIAIDAENAARRDDSCASHDHLDANDVMADAFAAILRRAPRASSSADAELMNAAWDRAKATGYAAVAQVQP
jgi:hypothetical protein